MQTLQTLLIVGLIIYSVVNFIIYLSRRNENKDKLRQLQDHGASLRSLTADEQVLVQPFLVNPAKKGKFFSLKNEKVYALSGEFVRHGLSTTQGGEKMHDTLGDVDVVLPYDARDFLESWNSAEIVLTDSFAIVISLNKRFDLKGGRERAQRKQVQDKQWANGQTGELPEAGFMAKAAAVAGNINVASTPEDDLTQVKILGQRDETTNEASVRRTEGQGWLATSVLVPAFALLLIAADQTYTGDGMELWFWMIPCLLLFALALWLIWGPRATGNRLKVNRVSGSLNLVTLQNPGNSTIVKTQMFLGDKFPIVFPKQWANWAEVAPNGVVDLDMRVDDYSVVRMGNKLSLDQEEQRFPSVFWVRHLTLSTVGALMLLAAWINSGSEIAADLAHAEAGLKSRAGKPSISPNSLWHRPLAWLESYRSRVRCVARSLCRWAINRRRSVAKKCAGGAKRPDLSQ